MLHSLTHSVLPELIRLICDFRFGDNNSEPNSVHIKQCGSDVNKYHHSVSRNNKSAAVWVGPEQWSRNVGVRNAQNVVHFWPSAVWHISTLQLFVRSTTPVEDPLFKQFVLLQNTVQTSCDSEEWLVNSEWPDWLDSGLKFLRKLITPSFGNQLTDPRSVNLLMFKQLKFPVKMPSLR